MKNDKGFNFNYWNLSYRRKFIRTIWIVILTTICIWYFTNPPIRLILVIGSLIAGAIQGGYTYMKWKDEEKSLIIKRRK